MRTARLSAVAVFAVAATAAVLTCSMARAQAPKADDAAQILKSMSNNVASQKNVSLTYDSDVDVIRGEVENTSLPVPARVSLSQPDKVREARSSGDADGEIVFDGKTASLETT